MTVIISSLAFFLLLSILILIHEFGHFYAAKKAGVVVEEFGFGLPPQAKVLFRKGGTDFSLNWIPFGGFVRLRGENSFDDSDRKKKGNFSAASVPARIVILCAGVFMNFLLAIVILTFGFSYGQWIPTYSSIEDMREAAERGVIGMTLSVRIAEVMSGGGAAKVGVPEHALIVKVDGNDVSDPAQVSALQEGKNSVNYSVLLYPEYTEAREFAVELVDGKSGVSLTAYPHDLHAPTRSIVTGFLLALRESGVMMEQTVIGMGQLFFSLASSGSVPEGITGIVGIYKLTQDSVLDGFMTYLRLLALLSLSLAALNILPFPALDGGRLLFVLVEAIGRRPVNRKFEVATNGVGFVFLILLILIITYYDILRLF